MTWTIKLRGGEWDGMESTYPIAEPVLIAWRCGPQCEGHFTMDPSEPGIKLDTAVAYKRTERDEDQRVAVYEIGEDVGGRDRDETRELVGAGVGHGGDLPLPGEHVGPNPEAT
jgi:hypothetical protein